VVVVVVVVVVVIDLPWYFCSAGFQHVCHGRVRLGAAVQVLVIISQSVFFLFLFLFPGWLFVAHLDMFADSVQIPPFCSFSKTELLHNLIKMLSVLCESVTGGYVHIV
jgi:hypothetical protein